MDDDRQGSILWWPIRVISGFRVHLIVTTVIGTVWCAGWVRSMQPQWSPDSCKLPPLVMDRPMKIYPPSADQPADDATVDQSPALSETNYAPHGKKLARRIHPHDPLATLRDGVE
jgi:hypothetical protein